MKATQLVLDKSLTLNTIHGGEASKGRRKTKRPLATKRAMHLVMRAEAARGGMSLLKPRNIRFIKWLLSKLTQELKITIYERSINSNHIHLLIRAKTREDFQRFLRILAGQVGQFVTEARRGNPYGKRFWDYLAFSRIVEWGNAFRTARAYVIQNQLEAIGAIRYQPRRQKRKLSTEKFYGRRNTC